MAIIGPSQSPVVERTYYKKLQVLQSKTASHWGLMNFLVAVLLYMDLYNGYVRNYLDLNYAVVWYIEVVLVAIVTMNILTDLTQYATPFWSPPVELSPRQMTLLRVNESDPGFKLRKNQADGKPSPGLVFSPNSYSPHSTISGSPPRRFSPVALTPPHFTPPGSFGSRTPSPGHPSSRTPSPYHGSAGSRYGQPFNASGGSGVSPSLSGSFIQSSPMLDQSNSFSASFNRSGTGSPLSTTNTLSPLFRDAADITGLRSRAVPNMCRSFSPMRDDEITTDKKAFEKFMKEQEDREKKIAAADTSMSNGSSFWNYGRTASDYTPILRKYKYQVACKSPQSTKSPDNDPDDSTTFRGEEVWGKLHVFQDEVDGWIENLRKWLSQTILARVVQEIKKINRDLERLGSDDVRIGEVSISTLKQLAVTKGQLLGTLNNLIAFLEVSPNQEYLVKRICQLGEGGCMPDFKWNGGSQSSYTPGKLAQEVLVLTDCEIVMHIFCAYMDFNLPPMPKYPDGKTFTSQYFKRHPEKPDLSKSDGLLIYQSKTRPPHYKVIIGETVYDLPKGRNNMFQAMLLFLYHVKHKHNGMLGRINLGLSGINVLWVLDTV